MPPELRPPAGRVTLGEQRRRILGVNIVAARRDDAVALIERSMDRRPPVRLAFANAHMLNLAANDEAYRQLLAEFFVLNDGLGVDFASRLKYGAPFPDNLNGTDFVPYFLGRTALRLRLFLLGGRPSVVERAARVVARSWPQHVVVGWSHGYLSGPDDESRVIKAVRDSGADVVLVGTSNPRQEYWIGRHAEATGAQLLVGVGALLDFLSGEARRAPQWVRDVRCEWLFRLAKEPRRLAARYVAGGVTFIGRSIRDSRRF